MATSFKPAVKVHPSDTWSYNALRFKTKEEAMQSARDLMGRWLMVTDYDAHESEDAPNYQIIDNVMTEIPREVA